MTRPAWYDVEMRGRRLEAISKQMNTMFWNNVEDNPDMSISYLERMLKIEHTILPYIEQMTGVKKILQQGRKIENLNVPA